MSGVAVEPGTGDEIAFARALDALLRQLAIEMVADGEGAERVARLVVRGPVGDDRAGRARGRQLAARQVRAARRRSQLGPDAAGRRPGPAGRGPRRRSTCRSRTCRWRRAAAPWRTASRRALDDAMSRPEVEMRLDFAAAASEAEIFFCDLGPEYVRFNSEYST